MRRYVAVVAALLAAAVLAGCSVGGVRRAPPARSAPPASATPARTVAAPEVRAVDVPVPRGYRQHTVEFVDADRGYALFTSCGDDSGDGCNAILLATTDGGRSWERREHPSHRGENQQLYAAGETVVLLAEPHGYYVSKDAGRTYTAYPYTERPPDPYWALGGGFQLCCDTQPPEVVEWVDDRKRPVPTAPPVPGLSTVGFDGRVLHAVGLEDGKAYAVLSTDRGKTWRQVFLGAPQERLAMVQIMVSTGADPDVWLAGNVERFAFPHLWRFDGQGWRPVGATGHPDGYGSVAPAGRGVLAVTGPAGSGLVEGGAYRVSDWPVAHAFLQALPDGTLVGRLNEELYLGVGEGVERRWAKIVLNTV
jgi:hypothetical protein